MTISIEIANGYNAFQPGDEINGKISWSLPKNPKEVTINLMWRTEGKGTQDTEIVDSRVFEDIYQETGEQAFSFKLPIGPYSFSGKLISLCWCLEAFVKSGRDSCRHEITIAPNGEEIQV